MGDENFMAEAKKCCATVYPRETFGAFHGYRCTKNAKVERDGKSYCGTHDPEVLKARDEKRRQKWEEDSKKEKEHWERKRLLEKLAHNISTDDLKNYKLVKK
jgi:uncharacterized Zn finger protein (UPF0148 family)